MAWANKYRFRFDSVNGVEYNIYIQKDGYAGDVIQRKLGRSPVLKKKQNGPICGTSLELFAECAIDGEFAELYTSDPKEYKVIVYRDSIVIWTGFVSTELYSEPSIAPPYDVQIVATDGLGELKLNTYQAQGEVSLKALLIYLLGFTGSARAFYVASNLKHTGGTKSNMLNWTINLDFLDGKSCYEVLTKLLDSLHATITTYGDRWLIARETDIAGLLNSAGSLSVITCTASGTVSTASLAGIRKSVGKMGVADMFPNGNLSTAIEPARNSVVVKAPWHFVNAFEGSDLKTAAATSLWGHDNLEVRQSIFDPWLPATHAVAGSGYYVGDTLIGDTPAYISRQFSVANINGISFTIDATVIATVVNPTNIWRLLGSRLLVYLEFTDQTGTLYWTPQRGWHADDLIAEYEDIGAAASEQKSERQFSVPPCTLRTTSSGSLVLYISGFNFCAEYANMQIRRPEAGYQDTIYIDNGARGADNEVEIVGGRVLSDNIPEPSFFQGLWKYNGSLLYSFADSYHSDVDFMSLQALDRAVSVALARTKTEGVVDVPSGVSRIPLVIRQGSQNSWVNTWEWDMVKADVKISAMSIPNANITVEDEVVEPMTGSSGSSSSGGGSSYSGGGSSTGGGGASLLRVWQSLTNNGELEEYGPETKIDAAHLPDLNYFEEDGNGNIKLKDQYSGLWASGFITAGGVGTGGSGGGVDVLDVWKSLTNNPSLAGYDDNTQIAVAHIPNLSWSKITSGKPTTLSGYGITDAYTKTETDSAISTAISALPNPMLFKGSLGTGGTITSLPAASPSNEGWTYKVITAGTYAGQAAKIGDMFISNGTMWIYVPSGDEPSGTVTSVGLSVPTGLSVSGSPITTSGTLAITFASGYSIPTTAKQLSWDAKYDKPSGGIPKTDLASAVQTSLGKADTAVQPADMADALDNYLPLTGGTLTGDLTISSNNGVPYTLRASHITSDGGFDVYQVDNGDQIFGDASNYGIILRGDGPYYQANPLSTKRQILHAGNSYVTNGVGTINGTDITTITGNAGSATKLSSNTAYTAFGNTFFQNGVPVSIAAGSNITGTGNILPNTNNSYNIGSTSNRFANIYGVNGNFSGTMSVTGMTSLSSGLHVFGDSLLGGNVTIGAGTTYPAFTLNANGQQGLKLTGEDATSNDYLIFKLGKLGVHTTPTSSSNTVEINGTLGATGISTLSGGIALGTSAAAQAATLVWDSYNNAWHLQGNFYADGFISAGGIGTGGSGGGGLIETLHRYADLGGSFLDSANDTFNAYTINKINTDLGARITALEGGSATSITTTGSGNVVSSVTKSGTVITVTKGITALTSHQTVTLASGTNNGTLKITTAAGTTDNIAVKGLAALAYKASLAFSELTGSATASQVPSIENLTNFSTRVYDATTSRTKNYVLAAPATANGAATFRKLVASDIPDLSATYLTSHQTVTLASGTNNGTLKLTTAAGTTDNIAVKGLGSLAYKSSLIASDIPDLSGTYLPLSGGTMTGDIDLSTNQKGIKLHSTSTSWTSSDRTIPFSSNGDNSYIRYTNPNANTGLTYNPNTGALKAGSFVKRGGTSSQFLKADGSVDSNSYLTGITKALVTDALGGTPSSMWYNHNGSAGYWKIHIKSTASWFLAFSINLYSNYTSSVIRVSGYNYSTTKQWYNPRAFMVGSTSTNSIDVTFGKDGDKDLWVVIPVSSYNGISITDVVYGNTGSGLSYDSDAFEITKVTEIPQTVVRTVTVYPPLSIYGGTISGDLEVSGTLGVTGATTLSSTLNAGATTLASLGVTGAATIGSTLGVTGAVTLSSTLSAGASTLASLGVTGAATIGTTLGVTGATTLGSTLTVTGNILPSANNTYDLGSTGASGKWWDNIYGDTLHAHNLGDSNEEIWCYGNFGDGDTAGDNWYIDANGNATFAGNLVLSNEGANKKFYLRSGGPYLEAVNIGTTQAPVWAIHSSVGFYSDSFITAGGIGSGGGGGITIDDALSPTSENPVQNKVIYATIGDVESLLAAI